MSVLRTARILRGLGLRNRLAGQHGAQAGESEASAGDDEPVDWVAVATTLGQIEASIVAGRLNSEGIPTRIRQEAAGAALGLSVGLGQIHVLVPEPQAERAVLILEATVPAGDADGDDAEAPK